MATIAVPLSGITPTSSGMTVITAATASAAVTAGQFLYSSGSGTVAPADAVTNATVVGVALFDAANTQPCYYVGTANLEFDGYAGMTANQPYFLSGSSGQIELQSDLSASENISQCGIAVSATKLRLSINNTGLTV